ncbi:MAG TPA: hypothetical protein VF975_03605, partial [Thermoanaerobaculia bacterium]
FAPPALWYLGMAIFDSIPLSALVMLLGAVTTVDNERILFEIAVLALLIVAIRRSSKALFALAGVAAGVALFFSLDIGLYAIGGAMLTLLVLAVTPSVSEGPGGAGGAQNRHLAHHPPSSLAPLGMTSLFLIGALVGAAPFVLYLEMRGAFGAFLTTSFVVVPRVIDAVWSLPFPDLTTTFRRDLNLHTIADFFLSEKFRFVLNPLVIGIAIVVLVQRAIRRKADWLDVPLIALTAFAILTQRSALGRADFAHQYFSAFLIGPMILILLVFLRRAAGAIATVALLPFLFVALWVPDIVNSRLDDATHYLGRVSGIGWVDPSASEIRHRIDQVRYFVTDLSQSGAPIFDFSNQPAFYFFCDRPNPTRFYQVPILSPPEFQREVILALERAKPPIVIRRSPQEFDVFDGIDNSVRAQAVASYINDYYSYAASTWGVEIWTRNAGSGRLNLDGYMRQVRLPSMKELGVLGERERLVFPSVGSVPGASETYWKSDLMLHNPFTERMSLALRYASGDIHADRHVVLGAGQSIRWEDVTRALFHAPEGRGALWIEYRGNVPPVARVKTYDAAHNARASIIVPLSMRDTAKELIIAAIPSGTERRVNLGLVNIGEVPATFRISVRTRTGQRVGRIINRVLSEDELYVLEDAERALGIRFDETMTVGLTISGGTAVGYASVVDVNGDSQFLPAVPAQ